MLSPVASTGVTHTPYRFFANVIYIDGTEAHITALMVSADTALLAGTDTPISWPPPGTREVRVFERTLGLPRTPSVDSIESCNQRYMAALGAVHRTNIDDMRRWATDSSTTSRNGATQNPAIDPEFEDLNAVDDQRAVTAPIIRHYKLANCREELANIQSRMAAKVRTDTASATPAKPVSTTKLFIGQLRPSVTATEVWWMVEKAVGMPECVDFALMLRSDCANVYMTRCFDQLLKLDGRIVWGDGEIWVCDRVDQAERIAAEQKMKASATDRVPRIPITIEKPEPVTIPRQGPGGPPPPPPPQYAEIVQPLQMPPLRAPMSVIPPPYPYGAGPQHFGQVQWQSMTPWQMSWQTWASWTQAQQWSGPVA